MINEDSNKNETKRRTGTVPRHLGEFDVGILNAPLISALSISYAEIIPKRRN